MNSGFLSQPRASFKSPRVPWTFDSTAVSSGASKTTEAAEWITASTSRESSARSSSPSPSGRRVYVTLEDTDLFVHVALELTALFLPAVS